MTNPLKLSKANRTFYEALLDLHHTDINDESWIVKYRRVNKIKKAEGKNVIEGWRCFHRQFGCNFPLEIAELFF